MFDRKAWERELQVGDVVCTCRYEHRTIVRIQDVSEIKNDFLAVTSWTLAVFSLHLAAFFRDTICGGADKTVAERIVYFADGTDCHASQCLDPPADCLHE